MSLIEEIKRTVRITDLVSKLAIEQGRKTSKGFFVSSIYKEEKTPSMQINVTDDTFHCFATGNGGDVIQLYQDFYRLDAATAVRELANIFGIAAISYNNSPANSGASNKPQGKVKIGSLIPKALHAALLPKEKIIFEKEFDKVYIKESEFELTEALHSAFEKNLQQILIPVKKKRLESNTAIFEELIRYCNNLTASDKPFYDYLVGIRKLQPRKVLAFRLAFISDYYKVNNHMKKAFKLEDLQRSGLFNRKCAKCDSILMIGSPCVCGSSEIKSNLIFYNHRIIIPYLHEGKAVYLRARYFDQNNSSKAEKQSKYIGLGNDALNVNTARRFFNFDVLAKMFKGEHLLFVEGELDAIAGECLGKNTIAIPGAQNIPAPENFEKFLSYKIFISGDNDSAGSDMVKKLTQIFYDLNKEVTLKKISYKDLNDLLAA